MKAELPISVATFPVRRYDDLSGFQAHLQDCAQEARAAGSQLLLLPELTCLGLLWTDTRAGAIGLNGLTDFYREVLTPLYPRYCEILSATARQAGLALAGVSYWHEREGKAVNTGFFVTPDGTLQTQDKLHMTRGERAIQTEGGDAARLFELDGVKIGMAICYDIQFPEFSRLLADAGAELLLVPSLTDRRGAWRVKYCAHARAIENQVYVAVSPLIGDLGIPVEAPVTAYGGAFVACPADNKLKIENGVFACASEGQAGLLGARLDIEALRLSREKAEIRPFTQRRPGVYADIHEQFFGSSAP